VDAVFTGEVTEFSSHDSSEYHEATKYSKAYTSYTREVTLSFSYRLIRARDSSIVGIINKSGEASSSSSKSSGELQTPTVLAQGIVNSELALLNRDVAPWTAQEQRTLMDETSKDKTTKQRMKEANALVKEGSYKAAWNAYDLIYKDTGSFAAGYNRALLSEIQGDLSGAISYMQTLHMESGNPKAETELARMLRTQAEGQEVEQFNAVDNLRDQAVNQISKKLISVLGDAFSGGGISIIGVTSQDASLLEYIIDGLTTSLMKAGFKVLDRKDQALITMEQYFQISGAVDDDSAVSVGHLLGVNYMVTCSITGSSNLRRLVIRVLSVETGEIVFQDMLEI
jgi:curli biogenesis system outer membrane secretion channel CsgG